MRNRWPWLLVLSVILLTWDLSIRLGIISPAALARPHEVVYGLPAIFSPQENLRDFVFTLTRSFLAFVLSVPAGVLGGALIFFGKSVRQPFSFIVDFLRSIPATALVPVFLIIYGPGDASKIAVGVFSSALVICLSTLVGFDSRNFTRIGVAEIMGLKGLRRLVLVDLPEALPHIFLGLRTGISLALILVVVSEMMIGSNYGLGKVIADMRYTDDKGRMYAALLVTGVIGYSYNVALVLLEKKIIHWRGLQ